MMMKQAASPVPVRSSAASAGASVLHRPCTCGGSHARGECEACRRKREGAFTRPGTGLGREFSHVVTTTAHAKNAAASSNGTPAPAGPAPRAPAAKPAAPAAPACAATSQATRMTACIQPVVIADDDGKNPTSAPSFAEVQSIWKKCCIDYTVAGEKTVKKKQYKVLDESPTNTPTQEEKDLFRDAGASPCIQVFVPQTFEQGGATGKHISGGGGTYDGAGANPKIVVVEGAVSEVVAHEVGHASGHAGHDADNTVMKPSQAHDKANSHDVSLGVCTAARTGSALTAGGAAKDCCMSLDPSKTSALPSAVLGAVIGGLVGLGLAAALGAGPLGFLGAIAGLGAAGGLLGWALGNVE